MPERSRLAGPALGSLAVCAVAVLAACWQSPTTGPGTIRWDRYTCERCQMVISDRRHAVQLRTPGEQRAHAFDDLGCALLWLEEQGLAESDPRQEVWVRDPAGAQWIDGYSAHFAAGRATPMAYGFGATERGLSLEQVRDRVRDAERRRRPAPKAALDAEDRRSG